MNLNRLIEELERVRASCAQSKSDSSWGRVAAYEIVLEMLGSFREEIRQTRDRSSVEEMTVLNKILGETASYKPNPTSEAKRT